MLVSSSLRMHGLLALSALVVLGMISIRTLSVTADIVTERAPKTVDIAVEHNATIGVTLNMSTLKGNSIIEIGHNGTEPALISLPEEWKRGEVRNGRISEISSETPMLGFTRWNIPPGASVTFQANIAPDSILMHNPSKVPMKVNYVVVDLETETVEQGVRLIMDDSVELW